MPDMPDWYERTLATQLEMTGQSWPALQQHGVTEQTPVELDFFYAAPDENSAGALATFLQDETDYEVDVRSDKTGMFSKKTWVVLGKTRSTAVSLDILNQWVRWMVLAGVENGQCEFDGWGAQAPG